MMAITVSSSMIVNARTRPGWLLDDGCGIGSGYLITPSTQGRTRGHTHRGRPHTRPVATLACKSR
jgi:hypothetical protein